MEDNDGPTWVEGVVDEHVDHFKLSYLEDVDLKGEGEAPPPVALVVKAVRLPSEIVEQVSTYRRHVNGHVFHATDELLSHPRADDMTHDLAATASAIA